MNDREFSVVNIALGAYFILYLFSWILESLYVMFNCLAWVNVFILIVILFKTLVIIDKELKIYFNVEIR